MTADRPAALASPLRHHGLGSLRTAPTLVWPLVDCDFLTAARDLYTNAVIPVAEPLEPSSCAGGGLVPGNSIHLGI